jgi:hypothetical protein
MADTDLLCCSPDDNLSAICRPRTLSARRAASYQVCMAYCASGTGRKDDAIGNVPEPVTTIRFEKERLCWKNGSKANAKTAARIVDTKSVFVSHALRTCTLTDSCS